MAKRNRNPGGKTGVIRIYKPCSLCRKRYWVDDLHHLNSAKCIVEVARIKMVERGWTRCGSGARLLEKCNITVEEQPSHAFGYDNWSTSKYAPAWASEVSHLFIVFPKVRMFWVRAMRDMAEADRAELWQEMDATARLSAYTEKVERLCELLVKRLGVPEDQKKLMRYGRVKLGKLA